MKATFFLAGLCAAMANAHLATSKFSPGDMETTEVSNSTYKHAGCGVSLDSHATDHFKQTIAALHHLNSNPRTPTQLVNHVARSAITINVPTYFHIVTKKSSAGSITPAMAKAQLAAMNARYNPHGISFTLKGTSTTVNDAWAVGAGSDDAAMKKALRKGTYNTLNIYFQTDLNGGILGTCSLPSNIGPGTPAKSVYISDGCNVQANTMPNGNIYGYNTGMTAVHETGHWLGLLHTFEGYSCSGNGDFVADTPMESVSTDGCPTSPVKDSCPGQAGVDPIHNYMDYSVDACYTTFTKGQITRIQNLWNQYRKGR
ncbi:hypothetical protein MBLNU457_7066t1 [Dothideomycetes sp. NU457]